ncbi:hypothetical protein MSIBF_A1830005 [groundwater metagenome]|uniref:Uncharacterized protein n=1 Tax=groundwater metagenome TaxID=717931 RepID=A0A098E8Y6_9ZZZZ
MIGEATINFKNFAVWTSLKRKEKERKRKNLIISGWLNCP